MIPVADYAKALEVSLLGLNLGLRVLAALLTELSGGYLAAGLSDLLFNLELNRETVAVPARDIGSVIAGERLRLEDDVLQDLVDGMPEMDIAARMGNFVSGRFRVVLYLLSLILAEDARVEIKNNVGIIAENRCTDSRRGT